MSAVAAWAEVFTEGWRAPADADSFADFFEPHLDPEIRLLQPRIPTMVGREAFREQFARPAFTFIPDLHADVHRWSAAGDDDLLFVEFTLSGTAGGEPVAWDAIDRIALRDGLATERRSYFDPGPLFEALERSAA